MSDKSITLSEADLSRLLARAQDAGAQQYRAAQREAEARWQHHEAMAQAMEYGAFTLTEADLRALMARGQHHEFCRHHGDGYCSCGVDALREQDREQTDEADALSGYGLV